MLSMEPLAGMPMDWDTMHTLWDMDIDMDTMVELQNSRAFK